MIRFFFSLEYENILYRGKYIGGAEGKLLFVVYIGGAEGKLVFI